MFKKFISHIKLNILLFIILVTSGCSLITKKVYIVPPLSAEIFISCSKPSSMLEDLNIKSIDDLSNKSNSVVDSLLIKAYAKTKTDHISCYRTLTNVQTTYDSLQQEVLKNNK